MDTAETPIFSGTATPYHGKQSNGVHPESLRSGLRDVELKQSPTTLGNRISDSYERMKRQFGAEVESRRSAIGGIDQMCASYLALTAQYGHNEHAGGY